MERKRRGRCGNRLGVLVITIAAFLIMLGFAMPLYVSAENGSQSGTGLVLDTSGEALMYYGHNWMTIGNNLYADQEHSPIAWRILENNQGTLTLLSDKALGIYEYNSLLSHGNWSQANICMYLNSNFMRLSFERPEQLMMEKYGEAEVNDEANNIVINLNQNIVLPSHQEVSNDGWFSSDEERQTESVLSSQPVDWWLRSPGFSSDNAAYVDSEGVLYPGGRQIDSPLYVRPLLKLDTSTVLFTSAAADVKSSAFEERSLVNVTEPAKEMKMTVVDDTQKLVVEEITEESNGSGQLEFPYALATTGENNYVSCILTDQNDEVIYYGRLAKTEVISERQGTVIVPLNDVAEGIYSLKIFSEQYNGDYNTDYAGSIHEYYVKVKNGTGQVSKYLDKVSAGNIVYYGHNWMKINDDHYTDITHSPIAWKVVESNEDNITFLSDTGLGIQQYNSGI